MTALIRTATADDAQLLHSVAAATFALACPPHTTQESIDDFIATVLSAERFEGYLGDPARALQLAYVDGAVAGYTMIVFGEPADADAAAAITVRPTAELSKLYVLPGHHGAGVSQALVASAVELALGTGCAAMWLGVNQQNARANRFYEKSGFAIVGSKHFIVGGTLEDDFVRERVFTS